MRTSISIGAPLLVVLVFAGCRAGAPAPQTPPAEDWYRKPGLIASFDADAHDLSLVNGYLLELACYIGDRGTFEVDRTLEAWGFDGRRDFRDVQTSTYGYVASNDRMVLVTFGGTDFMNVRDLLSDVDALQLVYDERYCATEDARVHRGFRDSLNSVIDGVIDEVRKQSRTRGAATTQPDGGGGAPPRKRLWIAGHSRGGAFAELAAAAMARQRGLPEVAGVYTYGQPRVGNGPFVESMSEVPLFRFVNRDDPIASVPPAGLLPQVPGAQRLGQRHGYQHGGIAVHLRADGRVVRSDGGGAGLPDPLAATASIGNHYQAGYHQAIYAALANPQMVEEPAWRATVPPGVAGVLPRPTK
jgi:hypothetical protein